MTPSLSVDLEKALSVLDLPTRLRDVPSTSMTRGVFFHLIHDELRRRGPAVHQAWSKLNWTPRRHYRLYPTRDILVAWATAGALVNADPHEGMREIFSAGSSYFSSTWFGSAMRAVLQPDPLTALGFIERHHDLFCNYGVWRLERRGPQHAVLHMMGEHLWLESAHRGGCEGLLDSCGVQGEVTPSLDSPFDGRLDIRWRLPS